MKKLFALAAAVLLSALLGSMGLAASDSDPAAAAEEKGNPAQEDRTGGSAGGTQTGSSVPGRTGLSRHNKAMLEQTELRKQRQQTIEKERTADPAVQQ